MKKWVMYSFKKVKGRFVMDRETIFDEEDVSDMLQAVRSLLGEVVIPTQAVDEYKALYKEVKHLKVSRVTRKKVGESIIVVMRIK